MNDIPTPAQTPSPDHTKTHASMTARNRDDAFRRTMHDTRTHLHPLARLMSYWIHLRPVALLSDIVGGTVARPNALLYGALSASLLTAVFYAAAKNFGYTFSGAEWFVAFFFGWLIGITIDYTQILIRGGRAKSKR